MPAAPIRKAIAAKAKRKAQVGEGVQGEIFHVAQGELVRRGMFAEGSGNVSRSRHMANGDQNGNRRERRKAGDEGEARVPQRMRLPPAAIADPSSSASAG